MSSKRGKGDGDEPRGEERSSDPGEDKVIRLPRDWLGPREDLVPFGPSADRQSQEPRESESSSGERDAPGDDGSARPPLEEVPPPPLDPVSPDDFWGERSAALQGPLDEADREAAVGDLSGPTSRQRRAPVLAAGAAAVVAIGILSVSLLGQSSPGPGRSGGSASVDSGGGRGTLWPLPAHTPLALHRAGRSAHGRSKRKKPTGPRQGAAVTVNYVRESSSSRSATGGGGSVPGTGSGGTSSSGTNPSPQTASSPTTSNGTAPTSPASPATPSSSSGSSRHKPPAFGSDGALGPGHSHSG